MRGQTIEKAFVPLAGGAVAVYTSSGLAFYRHKEGLPGPRQGEPGRSDWLGSSRFASTPTRTMYSDEAYAPFGEPYAQSGTADLSFTGMNQDTVSGLYDFPAREYATQGRWPSPDPAGIASVYPTDPQTWNRYAYVRNTPLHLFDPSGMKIPAPLMTGGGGGGGFAFWAATFGAMANFNPYGGNGGDGGGDISSFLGGITLGEFDPGAGTSSNSTSQATSQAPAVPQGDPTQACYADAFPSNVQWLNTDVVSMSDYDQGQYGEDDMGIFVDNQYSVTDQHGAILAGATITEDITNIVGTVTTPDGTNIAYPGKSLIDHPVVTNDVSTSLSGANGTFEDTPVGSAAAAGDYPAGSTYRATFQQIIKVTYNGNTQSFGPTQWTVTSSGPGQGMIVGTGLVSIGISRSTP